MRVNRGLLGWGVFFIVAGSIPLLVQAGVLDPARVRQVWQLWPLILIGIGLGLILQRTRAAIVGGLVVAATFGILVGGWFAVGFVPGAGFGACGIGGNDAGQAFPTQTGALQASATVKLDLSCGDGDDHLGDRHRLDGRRHVRRRHAADDHLGRRPARSSRRTTRASTSATGRAGR